MYQNLFERIERDKAARVEFIRKIKVDRRVIELLLALDNLSDVLPTAVTLPDGSRSLEASIPMIGALLGVKSKNTVRKHIDLAAESGFVQVIASNNTAHRFLILWQAIAASNRPVELTHQRGSTRKAEGVNQGVRRGSVDRVNLTPSPDPDLEYLIPEEKSKTPDPDLEGGGQTKRPARSWKEFWDRWKSAIASRDLTCPADIQFLYEMAVNEGLFEASEINRLNTFAYAAKDVRMARIRGWFFKEDVAYAVWQQPAVTDEEKKRLSSCGDEDVARKMIQLLDCDAASLAEFTELRPMLRWYLGYGKNETARSWCVRALAIQPEQWLEFRAANAKGIAGVRDAFANRNQVKETV